MSTFLRALADLLDAGQTCATATLIDAVGSTPGKPGHRMIVLPDGGIRFTIGGGPFEATVIDDCRALLLAGGNTVKEYRLLPTGDAAVGMVCGGSARVFIEVHPATAQLLVFGAGHVGREVIRMAKGLAWRRLLVDDREVMLAVEPVDVDVERIHCADRFTGAFPVVDSRTYVVVVTRCHETDREIVARLVEEPVAYLGMIGSRRKVETVLAELEERGVPRERLAHLHAPIGLDIGARSPAEIALAILAEIVSLRNRVA